MPWIPELFSTSALQQMRDRQRREHIVNVPYFDGIVTGEIDALVESFAGVPELHHPVRGRVKGAAALRRYADDTNAWLAERNVTVDDVGLLLRPERGVEEVVLHVDGDDGRIEIPMAIVADHAAGGRLAELRVYYSTWPLNGRHAMRPPVLQPNPDAHPGDVVGDYQRALAAGDTDAALATFDANATVREPAGNGHVHRGTDELRALYDLFFSNGGGVALEHCSVTDDGRTCALEYNVVGWGRTELAPEAGVAVYVRGESGKLAAARIYDDADPPLPGA